MCGGDVVTLLTVRLCDGKILTHCVVEDDLDRPSFHGEVHAGHVKDSIHIFLYVDRCILVQQFPLNARRERLWELGRGMNWNKICMCD
jgi:hypothetical protein